MQRLSSPTPAAFAVVRRALRERPQNKTELYRLKNRVCRETGVNTFADAQLVAAYEALVVQGEIDADPLLSELFRKRSIRTLSGIAPVSVLLPPAPCKSACVYCPTERTDASGKTLFQLDSEKKYGPQKIPKQYRRAGVPVMPKSYLSSEPGAMRALLAGFDPFVQISRRLEALKKTGHHADKCELIVQGGTFSDLKKADRTRFLTRCYRAFNQDAAGETNTLNAAQARNEQAPHRVVGLTLETRPGSITPEEVRDFRRLGCTRVEIGVQTLDDAITRKTKRIQTRAEVVRGTKLLRRAGFKICYHVMPGLPGSTPEQDIATYREMMEHPDFCPDLVKIYPCSVVPFSELAEWHKTGKYEPYPEPVLHEVLIELKRLTPPWVRISRLIRDIPGTAILGGSKVTNLRQLLQEKMRQNGECCRCIRCREIREREFCAEEVQLTTREYKTSTGTELFLSYELADETLLSMLRLSLPHGGERPLFRALHNAAIVRELHTFGAAVPVGQSAAKQAQHTGYGSLLLQEAERIAKTKGYRKLAVIAGIGVKDYYRRRGFTDEGTYLVKRLD